jgi:hypothetical protein
MKTLIYSFFIIILLSSCENQNSSFEIFNENFTDSIEEQLLIDSLYETRWIGIHYKISRPDLLGKLSHQTLLNLSKSRSPRLRTHAFLGLSMNEDFIYAEFFKRLYKDKSKIEVSDCLSKLTPINTTVLNVLIQKNKEDSIKKRFIDSVIIYSNEKISIRGNILYNLEPFKEFYPRIKELSLEKNNPVAFIALAKYQNTADVPALLSYFKSSDSKYYISQIANYFPHEDFFPFLIEEAKKTTSEKIHFKLLEAIWKYNSIYNSFIFEEVFNGVNYKAHLRLWSVLVKNKNEENNFMIKKFQKKYGEETVSEVTAERYDGKR